MRRAPRPRFINRLLARFGLELRRAGAAAPGPLTGGADAVLPFVFRTLVEHLQAQRPAGGIFFVQIGAFDGVSNDPLHPHIVAHRWRGILVEPQPKPFQALLETYRGHGQLAFVNAAIGEQDGETDFYVVRDGQDLPPWSQKIASLNKENVIKHREGLPEYGVRRGIDDLEERMEAIRVPVLTLPSLLALRLVERLDILQIDAEGYDARILRQLDFGRYQPALIRYEHMHLEEAEQDACLHLLRGHGYLVVIGFTETLAYRI